MPGIAIGNCIPFNRGGVSWSSYWTTRTPSDLALTVVSDVSITADWTANGVEDYDGYSIERSEDGVNYAEVDTVAVGTETFTDTGLTPYTLYYYRVKAYKGTNYSPASNIDSDTTLEPAILSHQTAGVYDFLWYDAGDVSNITKDAGTGEVSLHKNKNTENVPLIGSGGATTYPIWAVDNSITLDGINDYLVTNPGVGINQPTTIFALIKPLTWGGNATLIDGKNTNSGLLRQRTTTPNVAVYAGTAYSNESANLTLNEWHIVRIVFNGANSVLQVDDNAPITGNFGATNMNGITLGSTASLTLPASFAYKELLFSRVLVDNDNTTIITNYLKKKMMFDNGKLLITADDGYKNYISSVAPLLNDKGVKGTTYVIGAGIGLIGGTFLTWDDIRDLLLDGHDVQCHTDNHKHLTTLSEADVLAEYTDLDDRFTANGVRIPIHTAYPFGESNDNVRTWTSMVRASARGTAEGLVTPNTDKYNLPSYSISIPAEANMDRIAPLLVSANTSRSAVILYVHAIDVENNITSSQLAEIIDFAKSLGMDIITHSELIDLM
jgi:peptidoglycan/xylan/chitin deacetylase (PgdA/CDA1 family)